MIVWPQSDELIGRNGYRFLIYSGFILKNRLNQRGYDKVKSYDYISLYISLLLTKGKFIFAIQFNSRYLVWVYLISYMWYCSVRVILSLECWRTWPSVIWFNFSEGLQRFWNSSTECLSLARKDHCIKWTKNMKTSLYS